MKKLQVWRDRLSPPTVVGVAVRPTLKVGDTGAAVVALQKFLNRTFPGYSQIDLVPKRYGPQTAKVVAEFQRRAGVSGPGVSVTGRLVGPPRGLPWSTSDFAEPGLEPGRQRSSTTGRLDQAQSRS